MCENEKKLTLEKFEEATEVVGKVISETKLVYSEHFSNMTGNKVYFKPENMQYTGAYKVRGAYYKISTVRGGKAERTDYCLRRKPRPGSRLCGQAGRH